MKTKFNKSTTLNQAIDELEYNGLTEITRITSRDNAFTFEYEVEK